MIEGDRALARLRERPDKGASHRPAIERELSQIEARVRESLAILLVRMRDLRHAMMVWISTARRRAARTARFGHGRPIRGDHVELRLEQPPQLLGDPRMIPGQHYPRSIHAPNVGDVAQRPQFGELRWRSGKVLRQAAEGTATAQRRQGTQPSAVRAMRWVGTRRAP
jgi:hypothetical protein